MPVNCTAANHPILLLLNPQLTCRIDSVSLSGVMITMSCTVQKQERATAVAGFMKPEQRN
jgi:hypothetical protein